MEVVMNSGIAFIVWLQSLGSWLVGPMQFFSFFGSETFFLILLPLIYWCVDTRFAVRIGVIVLFSSGLNESFKLVFHAPRPYWFSPNVKAYAGETTFGIPSGHSQSAMVLFGTAASQIKRRWAWQLAIFFIFMIGLSRLYLGVHFPQDVLFGWAFGALLLWAFVSWWEPVAAWAARKSLGQQIGLAFVPSAAILVFGTAAYAALGSWSIPAEWLANAQQSGLNIVPAPVSLDNVITSAAALFGLLAGVAWINARGGYNPGGSIGQRALRLLPGLLGILVCYLGLGLIFPKGAEFIPYALRFLRYTLVGGWVSAGAPWLFQKLALAQRHNS